MWTYLRRKLGLTRMEDKIDMADQKISDLTSLVGGIADELPIIVGDNDAVLAIVQQLLANAANPQSTTQLSPNDQTAVNTMFQKLQATQTSLSSVDDKMKAAIAAVPPAPAPAAAPAASAPASPAPAPSDPSAAPAPGTPPAGQ